MVTVGSQRQRFRCFGQLSTPEKSDAEKRRQKEQTIAANDYRLHFAALKLNQLFEIKRKI